MTYILDTEPLGRIDEDGQAQYALRDNKRPETVICYQWFSPEDAAFWAKLLNSQAEKAWELGAGAMSGQDNGGPMAENPFTPVRSNVNFWDGL